MGYQVAFISLGCAKNQVNCEQMMAAAQAAGHTVTAEPAGADVAVVNTCGFLSSACEEAIGVILEMAELVEIELVDKLAHAVGVCLPDAFARRLFAEGYHFMAAFERIELLVYIAVHLRHGPKSRRNEN